MRGQKGDSNAMLNLRATAITALLVLCSVRAQGADYLRDNWFELIRQRYPANCAVELLRVGTILSGFNGLRKEQWFLKTCNGDAEYLVTFYPPDAFPGRHSPFEVQEHHAT